MMRWLLPALGLMLLPMLAVPGAWAQTPLPGDPAEPPAGEASAPAIPAPAAARDETEVLAYRLHRAVAAVRFCDGRRFTEAETGALAARITDLVGSAVGPGRMLLMMRTAEEDAYRSYRHQACEGARAEADFARYAEVFAGVVPRFALTRPDPPRRS